MYYLTETKARVMPSPVAKPRYRPGLCPCPGARVADSDIVEASHFWLFGVKEPLRWNFLREKVCEPDCTHSGVWNQNAGIKGSHWCISGSSPNTTQFIQCYARAWPQPSVGCFCCRSHTASSSQCRCWAPPTPLLLVCRTLYSDAIRVFYGENRFIIIDGPNFNPYIPWAPGDYPQDTFAVSEFLRTVVPRHCLGYIRFLEVAFAPFTHLCRPRDGHPALQDWPKMFDWAKNQRNLPALTLRLVFAGNRDFRPEGSGEMTRDQGKKVLAAYNSILDPARRLDPTSESGLARFYADLAWPLTWTHWRQ